MGWTAYAREHRGRKRKEQSSKKLVPPKYGGGLSVGTITNEVETLN